MSGKLYPVPAGEGRERAWLDAKAYDALYKRSISDPQGFWGEIGRRLDWIKPYTQVKNTSFGPGLEIRPSPHGQMPAVARNNATFAVLFGPVMNR